MRTVWLVCGSFQNPGKITDRPPELHAEDTHRHNLLFPGIDDPHFLVFGCCADETTVATPAHVVDHV